MRDFIRTLVVLALLGDRAGFAQTEETATPSAGSASTIPQLKLMPDMRLPRGAPGERRQPRLRDVPSQMRGELERLSEEDIALDRKLIICRGC